MTGPAASGSGLASVQRCVGPRPRIVPRLQVGEHCHTWHGHYFATVFTVAEPPRLLFTVMFCGFTD
jgi:hypothetical protein